MSKSYLNCLLSLQIACTNTMYTKIWHIPWNQQHQLDDAGRHMRRADDSFQTFHSSSKTVLKWQCTHNICLYICNVHIKYQCIRQRKHVFGVFLCVRVCVRTIRRLCFIHYYDNFETHYPIKLKNLIFFEQTDQI